MTKTNMFLNMVNFRRALLVVAVLGVTFRLETMARVGAAGSVTVNVTTDAADANPGNGICETAVAGQCSLRAAIMETNASSGLDTVLITATGTITLTSALPTITKTLTITGPGATSLTVDANGSTTLARVFTLDSPGGNQTFSISDLTLTGGRPSGNGGGINLAAGDTLYLARVVVNANSVANTFFGGGIYSSGTLSATDTSLSNNSTVNRDGGGLYSNGGVVMFINSSVLTNTAGGNLGGGGLYSSGPMTLLTTTVRGNLANVANNRLGGGIYSTSNLTLTASIVSNNTAGTSGGGIYSTGTLTLTNSTVSNNTASSGDGGGIYSTAPLTLTNSQILTNTSNGDGGGIYTTGVLTLTSGTVSGNLASSTSNGGGIWNSGTLVITNSVIDRNTATTSGGGLYLSAGRLGLTNSTVMSNTASGGDGGGLANFTGASGATLSVVSSTVSNNSASNDGGGLYHDPGAGGTTGFLLNSIVRANTATRNGGGIYHNRDTLYITATLLTSNTAGNTATGGGVYQNGGTLNVFTTTISLNSAGDAGGIYSAATLVISSSAVLSNAATLSGGGGGAGGGGLFLNGAAATLVNDTFSGNSSYTDGGGILSAGGSTVSLNYSTLAYNTADADNSGGGNGGGLAKTGGGGGPNVTNSIIAVNTDRGGQAPDCEGTWASLTYSLLGVKNATCTLSSVSNVISNTAIITSTLGPLKDNAGPTLTHALLTGSPAVDAANPAGCVATDERGYARPIDGQGTGSTLCDRGAVEAVSVSITNTSRIEGDSGVTPMVFTATLATTSVLTVTMDYATAGNTAASGTDFVPNSGTLTFPPSVTVVTFTVGIIGDVTNEANETFYVNLTNAVEAIVGDSQGLGTILNDDAVPSLSISNNSITEGNSGTKPLTFTVNLSATSGQTVTVNYATSNGTATSGSDYVAATGTLTFTPGVTTQLISVTLIGDATLEDDETFNVNLSGAVNASGSPTAVGTILNDEPVPSLSLTHVSANEGNMGTTSFVFSATLSFASSLTATVNYATADGTATIADSDYVAASGTLTFPSGVTTRLITVTVTGDTKYEDNETFALNLSGATNASGSPSGTGTITNDDAFPGIRINNVSQIEGNSGSSSFVFSITLSDPSIVTATVDYSTTNGTALAGIDYASAAGTLTFTPGLTVLTATVIVSGDVTFEGDETFLVNLGNSTNATIAVSPGTGNIVNDDGPSMTISNVTNAEGNSGTANFVFTVSLTPTSPVTVTVNYTTVNGTATTADGDYLGASGTLTFPLGSTAQFITVTVNGDFVYEDHETFVVLLSNAFGAYITDPSGQGTIANDDPPPGLILTSAVTQLEGNSGTSNFVFTASLTATSGTTATVNYATANGTATVADGDYVAASGTLTFAPGVTTQLMTITVNGDTKYEPNETFTLNLSGATHASGSPSGTGTLTNDDGVPGLSLTNVTANEGNSGTSNFVFTASLTATSGVTATVNYATANGTATVADSDYVAASGTLTFAPGVTTRLITVTVTGDTKYENNETFTLNLSGAINASGSPSGTGTITNDDSSGQQAIFLPILRKGISFFAGPLEIEDNDTYQTANGALYSGQTYQGYPDDANDYFSVYLGTAGNLTIDLQNFYSAGQLQLFYQAADASHPAVAFAASPPYHIDYTGSSGWYYIRVVTVSGFSSTTLYDLTVTYP